MEACAKRLGDVAEIAEKFGGGGHIKAAGATLRMPITEAVQQLEAALLASIQKLPPVSNETKHRT